MIAIAGLGIAGSYLFRRMQLEDMDVEGYDPKKDGFYVPCGYATNVNRIRVLLNNVGMDAEHYVRSTAHTVIIATEGGRELELPSKGLCTIDKNLLESDLVAGYDYARKKAEMPGSSDTLLIDATGVSRYYLGPSGHDFLMHTKEYLTTSSTHKEFYFRYFSGGRGYYWEFPIGGQYHVGAGGESRKLVSEAVKWVDNPIRMVSRKIRLAPLFDDIFNENIIGIGEAIGTVSPITGEGILPSMESAEILFQQIRKYGDPITVKEHFASEIRSRFSRYPKLFQLLMDTRNGDLKKLRNLSAISSAKEDFENFGIELKIGKVLKQIVFT